jgi:hypothetical protein
MTRDPNIKHPVHADDGRLLGHVHRDDVNPAWWIATHVDGWRVPGIDAPTMRRAADDLRQLDRSNVL